MVHTDSLQVPGGLDDDEKLVSLAEDERNDSIPYGQQKLIEKH